MSYISSLSRLRGYDYWREKSNLQKFSRRKSCDDHFIDLSSIVNSSIFFRFIYLIYIDSRFGLQKLEKATSLTKAVSSTRSLKFYYLDALYLATDHTKIRI